MLKKVINYWEIQTINLKYKIWIFFIIIIIKEEPILNSEETPQTNIAPTSDYGTINNQ